MSKAACAKKGICNPPVAAAAQAGENLREMILAGQIPEKIAVPWLEARINIDERYVQECAVADGELIEQLKASEG